MRTRLSTLKFDEELNPSLHPLHQKYRSIPYYLERSPFTSKIFNSIELAVNQTNDFYIEKAARDPKRAQKHNEFLTVIELARKQVEFIVF